MVHHVHIYITLMQLVRSQIRPCLFLFFLSRVVVMLGPGILVSGFKNNQKTSQKKKKPKP